MYYLLGLHVEGAPNGAAECADQRMTVLFSHLSSGYVGGEFPNLVGSQLMQ